MLSVKRIKEAIENAERNQLFPENISIDDSKYEYWREIVDNKYVSIEFELLEEDSSILNMKVVLQDYSNDKHIIVYSYEAKEVSINEPIKWRYEGVWCDITEDMIITLEDEIKKILQDFERSFRLPSILEGK